MERVLHPGAYNSLLWKCSTYFSVMCVGEKEKKRNNKKFKKKGREHLQKRIGSESLTVYVYVYRDTMGAHHHPLGKIEKTYKDLTCICLFFLLLFSSF